MNNYLIGFVSGWAVFAIVVANFPGSTIKIANKALAECEATLPRNVHCKITAIPDYKNTDDGKNK